MCDMCPGYPIVIGLMKANGVKVNTNNCPPVQLIGDINTVKDATKLDFSGLPITGKWRRLHVAPMLHLTSELLQTAFSLRRKP